MIMNVILKMEVVLRFVKILLVAIVVSVIQDTHSTVMGTLVMVSTMFMTSFIHDMQNY